MHILFFWVPQIWQAKGFHVEKKINSIWISQRHSLLCPANSILLQKLQLKIDPSTLYNFLISMRNFCSFNLYESHVFFKSVGKFSWFEIFSSVEKFFSIWELSVSGEIFTYKSMFDTKWNSFICLIKMPWKPLLWIRNLLTSVFRRKDEIPTLHSFKFRRETYIPPLKRPHYWWISNTTFANGVTSILNGVKQNPGINCNRENRHQTLPCFFMVQLSFLAQLKRIV